MLMVPEEDDPEDDTIERIHRSVWKLLAAAGEVVGDRLVLRAICHVEGVNCVSSKRWGGIREAAEDHVVNSVLRRAFLTHNGSPRDPEEVDQFPGYAVLAGRALSS